MTDELNMKDIKTSLFSPKHWTRLIYMLLFALMLHVASIAMWVLCAMQFLFSLLTGKDNENLRYLGKSITRFIGQALDFLTYNTETRPFPFAEWPEGNASDNGNTSLVVVAEPSQDDETGQPPETDQPDESGHGPRPGE